MTGTPGRAGTSQTGAPLGELAAGLDGGRLLTDPGLVEAFRHDQTTAIPAGHPIAVVEARSRDDVVATLVWASRHGVPVVPRGAGTSLAGGSSAIDGGVVLSMARMDAIVELVPAERLAVVEPGLITAALDAAARLHGLMYAPDPSSYEISTIGGNIATNAGGLRCCKYGVTRESVLGLEAVLGDGRIVTTGRRTVKGVTGYDLTGLLVGSEGTLGVVTRATLRLRPAPAEVPVTTAATFRALSDAAAVVARVVAAGIDVSLLELIDRTTLHAIEQWKHLGIDTGVAAMLIAQCDGASSTSEADRLAALCSAGGASDVVVSSDAEESAQLIAIRRLAYPATERLGACLVEDVCVPIPALEEMIEHIEAVGAAEEVTISTVAHAGDGNLHPIFVFARGLSEPPLPVLAAADSIFSRALELGGTLTGEHGVGSVKLRWLSLEQPPVLRDLEAALKTLFDPAGILNPGRAI